MAFINPDATFGAQADRVHRLHERLADLRDLYGQGKTDARQVNINNIMMATNAAEGMFRILEWARKDSGLILANVLGVAKPEYINFVTEDWLRSSRLFLLLEAQFQIEALFRNILFAGTGEMGRQGFYNLAGQILKYADLSASDGHLVMLNIPALLRNSMHSNGIHHGHQGADTVETVDGLEFRLENGKRVSCGSWLHVCVSLTASLAVVEAILSSAAVLKLQFVADEYAVQKAAE